MGYQLRAALSASAVFTSRMTGRDGLQAAGALEQKRCYSVKQRGCLKFGFSRSILLSIIAASDSNVSSFFPVALRQSAPYSQGRRERVDTLSPKPKTDPLSEPKPKTQNVRPLQDQIGSSRSHRPIGLAFGRPAPLLPSSMNLWSMDHTYCGTRKIIFAVCKRRNLLGVSMARLTEDNREN